MSEETEKLFAERLGRYQAAIALEPTDRIPIATGSNYFAEVYSGNTNQETVYDTKKWLQGEVAFCRDFPEVDVLRDNRIWGPLFDAVGLKTYKLPGRDLPPNSQFQFVEQEYMKADEYPHFLKDPSDFVTRRFLPRMFTSLKGLQKFPWFGKDGIQIGARVIAPFMDPDVQEAISIMKKAAELSLAPARAMMETGKRLTAMGFPSLFMGFGAAPFDVLGDTLRGTRGILMDLYRCPENILKACEKILDLTPVPEIPLGAPPLIMMPLHKGDDTHISLKQFEKFYWPTFKQIMLSISCLKVGQ